MAEKIISLDSVLKKAENYSRRIEEIQTRYQQMKQKNSALALDQKALDDDSLSLIQSLQAFQQETVANLKELYTQVQAVPSPAAEIPAVKKPGNSPAPAFIKPESLVNKDETTLVDEEVFEVDLKPDSKPVSQKKSQGEVYLFDLE